MGAYSSFAFQTYKISKEQYDFLLIRYGLCRKDFGFVMKEDSPFVRNCGNEYYFIGTREHYAYAMEICEAVNW